MMQEQTHAQKQLKQRYDGLAKVTGRAKYSAEFNEPFPKKDLAYGYIVQSTIACGTLTSIDRTAAERSSGVIAVLTPFNAPKLPPAQPSQQPIRRSISALQDTGILYNGQPIALVVARSLAEAQHAASLLTIRYEEKPAKLEFKKHLSETRLPRGQKTEPANNHRGDFAAGMAQATVIVDETYVTPVQNHNPMEPHATIAWWEGSKLNLYDATQYITGVKMTMARVFQIPQDDVRVQCPYTGGGFGSKGSAWSHVTLAALAARVVGRPVKIALERNQMFTLVGGRATTVNHIKLGATADGKLTATQHHVVISTAELEEFVERAATPTRTLYATPSLSISELLVDQNIAPATYQRAPGEGPGTATLETAMDELAVKLNMDPLQLRLINYTETDPSRGKPFTSKHLREAYLQAAERFGWAKRPMQAGTVREGNKLIGYGMATGTYPANRSASGAVVRILPGGKVYVGSGTTDLGTGMYTIMAQTCANGLGLDPSTIEVKLGDSLLPRAPVAGGSQSTASVLPAVADATAKALQMLIALAVSQTSSPLHGLAASSLTAKDGKLFAGSDPSRSDTFATILERSGQPQIEAIGSAEPGNSRADFSSHSWGAIFAEVAVDIDTHMVQVRRVTATYDIGTVMNHTTAINQMHGGVVWGIGFALTEETVVDPVYGRVVNESFADYHVPVNADVGTVDITFLNIADTKFNPLGARGVGEIGLTGVPAAIGNAIYNATGKRVREFPITPDKIMRA